MIKTANSARKPPIRIQPHRMCLMFIPYANRLIPATRPNSAAQGTKRSLGRADGYWLFPSRGESAFVAKAPKSHRHELSGTDSLEVTA